MKYLISLLLLMTIFSASYGATVVQITHLDNSKIEISLTADETIGFMGEDSLIAMGDNGDRTILNSFDNVSEINILSVDITPITLPVKDNNTFGVQTTASQITVSLPKNAKVKIDLYNLKGQNMSTLANETFSTGLHTFTLNHTSFAKGTYLLVVSSDIGTITQKIIMK